MENKKRFYRSIQLKFVCAILCCLFGTDTFAADFPDRSSTLITDYTNTLDARSIQTLEQQLVAFNDSTSTQIAIVIMSSTGSYEIKDYAAQLGEKWGIGQKGKNNGVILLIAKDDRRMAIQVGYGLEPVLTDALSKRIIEQVLVPAFKEERYFEGLQSATQVIMSICVGEFTADQYIKKTKPSGPKNSSILLSLLPLLIIFWVLRKRVNTYARSNNIPFWTALALMNAASSRSRGSYSSFSSGSGGFGGSGGGFGGFGGGSFGGGGASGSW